MPNPYDIAWTAGGTVWRSTGEVFDSQPDVTHCESYHRAMLTHFVAGGNRICADCLEKWKARNPGWWKCDHCGKYHTRDVDSRWVNIRGGGLEKWCMPCVHSDSYECDRCGHVFQGEAITATTSTGSTRSYCRTCAQTRTWICEQCGERNTNGRDNCCCCGRRRESRDANLRRVMDYHAYTRHLHKKYVGRKVGSEEELFFGIELETSKRGNLDWNRLEPWIDNEESPKIHAEYDSSITGVEWISQPCTLKYWQEQFDIYGFCKALRSMGASAKSVARYPIGMHIHVTKRDALLPTLRKVDFYIHNEANLWKAISRRRAIYHCNEIWDCISNPKNGKEVKYGWNRYEPLNFRPEKTVELRTPRGTLDPKTILATIEWFHCVIKALEFVPIEKLEPKWIGFESVPIMKVTETTRDTVLPFLFANKDEYPHAVRMVTKIMPRMRQYQNHPEMKRLAKKKAWLKDHKPGKKRIKKAKKVFVFTGKK